VNSPVHPAPRGTYGTHAGPRPAAGALQRSQKRREARHSFPFWGESAPSHTPAPVGPLAFGLQSNCG
jgi:hypothetical protein